MTSTSERDARLRAVLDATEAWAAKKRAELERRVALSKRILQGRTGSERLARASVRAASRIAADVLEHFLTGV